MTADEAYAQLRRDLLLEQFGHLTPEHRPNHRHAPLATQLDWLRDGKIAEVVPLRDAVPTDDRTEEVA